MTPRPDGAGHIVRERRGLPGRRLATLALAASAVVCGAGPARAQTVIATHAPAGTTVEVVRDATVVGSAEAGPDGVARVTVPEPSKLQQDIDGLLYVDVCPDRRRVIILERHRSVAPVPPTCTREDIPGLFLIRPISTLAIDLSASPPRLLLRQGRFDPTKPAREWANVPLGLAFSAGAGINGFSDPKATACGNVADCTDDGMGRAVAGGVAFWFLQYLGAEVTFLRPGEWQAEGTASNYRFTSTLDAEMLTTTALIGGPVGPTRLYGKVGASYHRATFSTMQTIDDATVTVDGEPVLVQGGTHSIAYRTQGWGWTFGGGLEFWMSRYLALYAEMDFVQLKGSDPNGGEGVADDHATTILGGLKLHIGRK